MEITQSNIILWLIALAVGYLLGSILFAKILVKAFAEKDIEAIGDKNPGAKNTMLNVGVGIGAAIAILDTLKTLGPMLIAFYIFHMGYIFVFFIAAGTIAGHLYPLYFGFHGGRGAATLIGSLLFFIPYEIIIAAIIVAMLYLLKHFLKEKFLISITKMLMATVLVSFFVPHLGIVKIMILVLVAVVLSNKKNLTALKEWMRQVIQTVEKKSP